MVVSDAQPPLLTYAHLLRLRDKLDDRDRYELIGGDLQVLRSPGVPHQWALSMLLRFLSTHVWAQKMGFVFPGPLDVILTDFDVVQPDLSYLTPAQIERIGPKAIEEPPTLVVEVHSPDTTARDRGIKRELYERQDVPHYWLAHPTRRTLEVRELRGKQFELLTTLTGSAEFRPTLFPGLVIPLREIWPPRSWRARG